MVCTARWLIRKWTPSVAQPKRNVFWPARSGNARSSGMNTSVSSSRLRTNQSMPIVNPPGVVAATSGGVPMSTAASESPSPVSPSTLRWRSRSEVAASRNVTPITTCSNAFSAAAR